MKETESAKDRRPIIYAHQSTGFIYKLTKFEQNMHFAHKFYNLKMGYFHRIGDQKPQVISSVMLDQRYFELEKEEMTDLAIFMKTNPNDKNLPIKYVNGIFCYGSEASSYKKQQQQAQEELLKLGHLITPNEKDTLEKVVISYDVRHSLKMALVKLKHQDFLNKEWGFQELTGGINKQVLNFYGSPGTGKTLSAKAMAKELNKPIFQVDYSQVESKWVGGTGKNLKKVFEAARMNNAVLLFDEADSLVSKRQQIDDSSSQNYQNINRNIFMQELDKHQGVVILTTNFFANYDDAMLRRINQHVHFPLPDKTLRQSLIKQLIPKKVPTDNLDYEKLSNVSEGLSGGDLKNVVENSLISSLLDCEDPSKAKLTQETIESEIKKITQSKAVHNGSINKREIGISAKF